GPPPRRMASDRPQTEGTTGGPMGLRGRTRGLWKTNPPETSSLLEAIVLQACRCWPAFGTGQPLRAVGTRRGADYYPATRSGPRRRQGRTSTGLKLRDRRTSRRPGSTTAPLAYE